MLEEDLTPEAQRTTSTLWVEDELRRLFREREASRERWQQLRSWVQSSPTPQLTIKELLHYMDSH